MRRSKSESDHVRSPRDRLRAPVHQANEELFELFLSQPPRTAARDPKRSFQVSASQQILSGPGVLAIMNYESKPADQLKSLKLSDHFCCGQAGGQAYRHGRSGPVDCAFPYLPSSEEKFVAVQVQLGAGGRALRASCEPMYCRGIQ